MHDVSIIPKPLSIKRYSSAPASRFFPQANKKYQSEATQKAKSKGLPPSSYVIRIR